MDALEICNTALGWLGEKPIHQLNAEAPESDTEELCARLYPGAVRTVLEAKAWTFATKRIDLAPAELTGRADFPSRYPIPSTVVRVLACDDGSGSYELEWRREGAYVLAETSPTLVVAKVVYLVEDAKLFSPGFARAVAARLAAELALPLTTSGALAAAMEQRYARELGEAGRLDGLQGTSERQRQSSVAARRW